jgi:formylglycine-generating enzyme required for sulfatase activity
VTGILGASAAIGACTLLVDTDDLSGGTDLPPVVEGGVPEGGAADDASSDGASPVDAASQDAGPPPKTCPAAGSGLDDCGPDGGESCCQRLVVPGGTFKRDYDNGEFTDATHSATISSFRLDRFEVDVGRFRQFVRAVVDDGWRPKAGAGKHTHLNSGRGLSTGPATYEPGWDASWSASLATTTAEWNGELSCGGAASWSLVPDTRERWPANCVSWYDAYAFCIWDGGFLPSEAEWNFAASGGSEQRVYPWSIPASSVALDCSHANYNAPCPPGGPKDVGATTASGDSRWGHADLGGNVWELLVDWQVPLPSSCTNCAVTTPIDGGKVALRGGGHASQDTSYPKAAYRGSSPSTLRHTSNGFRCAYAP